MIELTTPFSEEAIRGLNVVDGSVSSAQAEHDVSPLQSGSRCGGAGDHPFSVAEHHLAVRAYIREDGYGVFSGKPGRRDSRGRVRADESGDARRYVDLRVRGKRRDPEFGRRQRLAEKALRLKRRVCQRFRIGQRE